MHSAPLLPPTSPSLPLLPEHMWDQSAAMLYISREIPSNGGILSSPDGVSLLYLSNAKGPEQKENLPEQEKICSTVLTCSQVTRNRGWVSAVFSVREGKLTQ